MEKGYIQFYTGDGKGKTTAALGLALRAVGRGMKVFIGQFAKGMAYGEHEALSRFSESITLRQFGRRCFIHGKPEEEDIRMAREGWEEVKAVVAGGSYDLVILDEAGIAIYYNLVTEAEFAEFLDAKPEGVELVLTGRKIPETLFDKADLVTEMREIKHYYTRGVEARLGVEY
ncbi:MAG: cob(I)yrinic acid a,c-diamide adenosyltransferase [Spirochaetales bacterium]|nr:cob(I)yrinic acid a,c-diamide adenosyltransferase [Spirochaetales bacterium]